MHKRNYQATILHWIPRQRFFTLLLALAVLFNFTTAYAVVSHDTPMMHSATGYDVVYQMTTSCDHNQTGKHKPCCPDGSHTCMMHCVSFTALFSNPLPVLQQGFINSKLNIQVDTIPLAYIRPPLLRPPRS